MTDDLAHTLHFRSKELYTLTVQYGQACLLGDKTKASSYWQAIIEGYKELDALIAQVAKLEYQQDEAADILSELDTVEV
jgi:hypothetical protein